MVIFAELMLIFVIILLGIIMLSLFLFLLLFYLVHVKLFFLHVITLLFDIRKCPWEPWAAIWYFVGIMEYKTCQNCNLNIHLLVYISNQRYLSWPIIYRFYIVITGSSFWKYFQCNCNKCSNLQRLGFYHSIETRRLTYGSTWTHYSDS